MGENSRGAGPGAPRPNILLVMTDQQRFDSLGCYGSSWTRTPVLDRMAREGLRFERCYANNPICTPSRASVMTGKELPGHGVYRLHDLLPADETLFPQRLREAGYRTALFGKLHVSGRIEEAARRHPRDGFDVYEYCCEPALDLESPLNAYARWLRERHPEFHALIAAKGRDRGHDPLDCSMNRWAADRTIEFLRGIGAEGDGRPFFCMMSVFDPHNPYGNYPLEMDDLVDAASIPAPLGAEDGGAVPHAFRVEREHCYMGSPSAFPPSAIAEIRRGYAAMVGHIDLEVGRVLAALRDSGQEEDTLVIFASDHGDLLGDHGAFAKGAMLHDPCVRVPLLMRWPRRIAAGGTEKGPVQLNDLAATILSAAGLPAAAIGDWMPDSADLLAGTDGAGAGPGGAAATPRPRAAAVCAYRNSGIDDTGRYRDPAVHATMVAVGRWKLHAYHPVAGIQPEAVYKLFDMETDPGEEADLAMRDGYASILDGLKEQLVAWLLKAELGRGGRGGQAAPRADQLVRNALELEGSTRGEEAAQ